MGDLGGSTSIQDTRIYAQDTRPTDERDGVIHVDTSVPERPVSVFSTETGKWEPTAAKDLYRQPNEPSQATEGQLWVDTDTSPHKVFTFNGTSWYRVDRTAEEVHELALVHDNGYAPGYSG